MKQAIIVIAALSMAVLSVCALAEDKSFSDAQVNIVGTKTSAEPQIIHSKEFPNGLYVVAYKSLRSLNNAETDSPNINTLIRGLIAKRGFKLADHPTGSDMALMFSFIGDVDLAAVEELHIHPEDAANAIAEKKIKDQTIKATDVSFTLQGAVGGNKVAGVVGAAGLLGSVISSDKVISVSGSAQLAPAIGKGFFGGDVINKSGRINNGFWVYYRKANGARDITPEMQALLVIAVNKWIDSFMVLDVDPVAASGVTGTAASSKSATPTPATSSF